MDLKFICMNEHCFVCGEDLDSNKKSVLDSTSRSDKQIYKYLETFVGEKFEETVFSPSADAEICVECLEKFEQYDNICLQAARIQEDIANLFKENQSRLKDDQNDFLKCKTCFAQFLSFVELNVHDCIINEDDQFEITEYAEASSDTSYSIALPKASMVKVEPYNYYTCNICNEQFERKRYYQNHTRTSHLPENAEIFHCSQCNEGFFATENELKLHVVVSHRSDPSSPYLCPVCSKAFSTKALLNRHFGIHSADSKRPHVCEICGKTFFHYSSFRAHVKMHTDIRDFSCSHCTKSFRSQSHLNRHLKIHTKQKDHECQKCGSRFAERYNLTAHMKTHSGITRKRRLI